VDSQKPSGISRRDLIRRGAVAGGVGALVWAAPSIETGGFLPAGAFVDGSGRTFTSDFNDDLNSNSGKNDCEAPDKSYPPPCCKLSWGNSGSGHDHWVFDNPFAGCTQVVVELAGLNDCSSVDPDIAQSQLYIASQTGTCNCVILYGLIRNSNGANLIATVNNGAASLPCGTSAIDVSYVNCANVPSDARLGVTIQCSG
jgi:hypothetical protein